MRCRGAAWPSASRAPACTTSACSPRSRAVPRHRCCPTHSRARPIAMPRCRSARARRSRRPSVVAAMTQALELARLRDRARGRHGLGLSGRDPRAARRARDLDRARAAARGRGAPHSSTALGVTNVARLPRRRQPRAARRRAVRCDRGHGRRARACPSRCSSSSPWAGGSSARSASREEQQLLRIRRVAGDRYTRELIGRCRFVDLVGAHGREA